MSTPIGDPRPAGETGPAGDQRAAGEAGPAGDPRPAGDAGPAEVTPTAEAPAPFDPSAHTVDDVQAHLADAPDDERDRVLEAERNGKARSTILG